MQNNFEYKELYHNKVAWDTHTESQFQHNEWTLNSTHADMQIHFMKMLTTKFISLIHSCKL